MWKSVSVSFKMTDTVDIKVFFCIEKTNTLDDGLGKVEYF